MDINRLADILRSQNFAPNDSVILSAINHPLTAAQKGADWFAGQVNRAANIPEQYDNPNPLAGYTPEQQVGGALNLAGLMQTSAFPFAPKSAGGVLGTITKAKEENLNAGLIQKYLQEGKLSPEEMAQYEKNAVRMTEQGMQKYNVLNANAQGGTPKSRAIDLGFYTENTLASEMPKRNFDIPATNKLQTFYHGGPSNFDMSGFKEASGANFYNPNNINGGYAFLTSKKDEAGSYAGALKLKKGIKTKVHEFYVRPEDQTKLISTSTANYLPDYKQLKENGYGQTLVDLGRYGKGDDDTYYRHEWLLPYSPEQIRSIKAAFDPLRKASPNLLAGGALGSLLLNEEMNKGK